MALKQVDIYGLVDYLSVFFPKYSRDYHKSLSAIVTGIIHSVSCSTGAIATAISSFSGKNFSASDKQIRYFLSNVKFQIDDALWRCYLKLVFSFLSEGGYIKKGQRIFIQVDFTSKNNDFQILCASIVFRGRAVPIYFTTRLYPKRKGSFDQIKMEKSFVGGLFHCLSKQYQYVIIADRGFGNQRFVSLCEEHGIGGYILRLCGDIYLHKDKSAKLKECKKSKTLADVFIPAWDRSTDIIIRRKKGKLWYLCSNLKLLNRRTILREYERRTKIECCFKDMKSQGFNIEQTKIRKYDRFRRLLFSSLLSYVLMIFTGDILKHNHHAIKKNFPQSVNMILAFSSLQSG